MQMVCNSGVTLSVIVKIPVAGTSFDRLSIALTAIGAKPEVIDMHVDGLEHVVRKYRMIAHGPNHQGDIVKAVQTVPGAEIISIEGNPSDSCEPETLALASFSGDRVFSIAQG